MTTGEKIAKHRRERNMTQEQLADLMGVSRQAVSKWESDIAFPETEKLIQLCKLFDCSADYLLKPEIEEPAQTAPPPRSLGGKLTSFEYVSKRTVKGIPLVHVSFAPQKSAHGIIAVGFRARGIVSLGLFSMGIVSVGILSLGLLAFGVLGLGLLAFGSIAAGGIAFGGVALGLLAVGGVAVGLFSCGGLAVGHYFAYGDYAIGKIAVGQSFANGSVWSTCGDLLDSDRATLIEKLRSIVPSVWHWVVGMIENIVHI